MRVCARAHGLKSASMCLLQLLLHPVVKLRNLLWGRMSDVILHSPVSTTSGQSEVIAMAVPSIALESAHDYLGESESKLSDEERKVLGEIRLEKELALERIKVRTLLAPNLIWSVCVH